MPASPEMRVAAARAGLTPAAARQNNKDGQSRRSNQESVPVDLYKAPVNAPAAILPYVSCWPRKWSIEELKALYTRAGMK